MAVIDVTAFQLRPDVGDADFLAADRAVQTEFIPNHEGLLRRTTARGARGNWMVLTLWDSGDNADASAAMGADDVVVARFSSLIDPATVRVARYETLD